MNIPLVRPALSSRIRITLLLTGMMLPIPGYSQLNSAIGYSVKLTLQGSNMPFKNILDNFKNPGISFGLEYEYDKDRSRLQTLSIGWLGHAQHGNSMFLSSQFVFRPSVNKFRPGIAIGVGRMFYFNNANPLFEKTEGKWAPAKRQTEGRWALPISAEVGFQADFGKGHQLMPFVGYELIPVINYNSAFPVLPSSLLTLGSKLNGPKE